MKLIGAVILFFVCAFFGFHLASLYGRRVTELRQLRGALSVLETEIMYGNTPLTIALHDLGTRENGPIGNLFLRIAERLKQHDGRSVFDCWQTSVNEMNRVLALREQDRRILIRLGRTIGQSDRQDQIHHLRLAQTTLESEERQASEEKAKFEKLFRSLGVLTGALLVILMF